MEQTPENRNALWIIGKGYQALDCHMAAYDSFGMAYNIDSKNADVAREYMFECLHLGKSKEAVYLAQAALNLRPNDAGLVANFALALLIDA